MADRAGQTNISHMDTLQKLKEAMQYMKLANNLLQEAAEENLSLNMFYFNSINVITFSLDEFIDNAKGSHLMGCDSLKEMIGSESASWKNVPSDQTPTQAFDPERELYFYPTLRNWILEILSNDKISTKEEIIKMFTDKGIKRVIASQLIEAERENCLTLADYKIDFDYYEPDDDRIFTGSQMFDFAYEIGLLAMSAGFLGNKSINSLSLDKYISEKLDLEEGDGSYKSYIPRSKWPMVDEVDLPSKEKNTKESVKRKNKNRGKKP